MKIALAEGGRILMQHFGKILETKVKENISSVVTQADYASEKRILEVLADAKITANSISEEAGFLHVGSDFTWVIDPLDGTSNFAAELPWFGVIIALFRENEPLLAGMYLPVMEHLYLAEQGKGALRDGHPIRTSRSGDLTQHLVAYSFDYSDEPEKTIREMNLLARLSKQVRNIRSTNSLYDFCVVADGRIGAALNQTTKIWDIAAASLLIKEAGGVVSGVDGGAIEFDLTEGSHMKNYTIAAAGAGIHDALMRIVNPS